MTPRHPLLPVSGIEVFAFEVYVYARFWVRERLNCYIEQCRLVGAIRS